MPLKIYNSLTKKVEEFRPLEPAKVKMYVCGPTVYDEPHIGHLRSAYVFDLMRRYLKYSGYEVTFVRNVTDVDDKIIEKAREGNTSDLLRAMKDVSDKSLAAYKSDLKALGIGEPTVEPKATEHIDDMIRLIQALVKKGHAYESQGDVYFDVASFGDYGKLSHQRQDEMLDHVRIDPNEKKREPLDFALWKRSKEGEPSWESPWGRGRPGWHIECSAMSMRYLGETFDIHGGGRDLLFPHHENEIAQSRSATAGVFARYWVHHGLVTYEGQKMSKSLRNFVALRRIREQSRRWGKEELKFLFLGTRYGAPLDYSDARMGMERSICERFLYFFEEAWRLVREGHSGRADAEQGRFLSRFRDALDDDFNTPLALTVLHEWMHWSRKSLDPGVIIAAAEALERLFREVLGIFQGDVLDFEVGDMERELREQIQRRDQARQKKDFKTADRIREDVRSRFNIELIDLKGGVTSVRKL